MRLLVSCEIYLEFRFQSDLTCNLFIFSTGFSLELYDFDPFLVIVFPSLCR